MKLVKFLAASMAAIAMLAACESTEENKGGNENDDQGGGIIVQEFVNVYCDISAAGWEKCGVWAWDLADTSINYTGGVWPGQELTETEDIDGVKYYIWQCPKDCVGTEIGFIINEFVDGGAQTVDIKLPVEDGVKVAVVEHPEEEGKWIASINGVEIEIPEEEPVEEPVVVLADHTWGVIGVTNWDADNFEMTVSGNTATATFDAGENAEFKVRANGAWDVNYGFAAPEEGALAPVDGTEFPAAFNAGNIKVVEAGNYTLTLTIEGETETFTLKKN